LDGVVHPAAIKFATRSPDTPAVVLVVLSNANDATTHLDRGISLARLQAEINRVSYAGLSLFAS
jgi:hypothetical protein